MEALGGGGGGVKPPTARRGARQRAGLTHASASNALSCERETGRSKNPIDRNHGIYRYKWEKWAIKPVPVVLPASTNSSLLHVD
jgi:hypothetical protein